MTRCCLFLALAAQAFVEALPVTAQTRTCSLRLRRGNKIAFGDGDNRYLRSAIRAHANFAEYVPIIVIMNALLEMGGGGSVQMHVLLGTLMVSRILHPFGMHAKPMTPQFIVGRIVGVILTFLVLLASALLLLRRFALS
jgi:uncharacterized membrane protein YecN with MAPEG domain